MLTPRVSVDNELPDTKQVSIHPVFPTGCSELQAIPAHNFESDGIRARLAEQLADSDPVADGINLCALECGFTPNLHSAKLIDFRSAHLDKSAYEVLLR